MGLRDYQIICLTRIRLVRRKRSTVLDLTSLVQSRRFKKSNPENQLQNSTLHQVNSFMNFANFLPTLALHL
nr:MAG: hypothetical protein EDM05_08695 [Leptolyngbya sp. IPPAS B-1204]